MAPEGGEAGELEEGVLGVGGLAVVFEGEAAAGAAGELHESPARKAPAEEGVERDDARGETIARTERGAAPREVGRAAEAAGDLGGEGDGKGRHPEKRLGVNEA